MVFKFSFANFFTSAMILTSMASASRRGYYHGVGNVAVNGMLATTAAKHYSAGRPDTITRAKENGGDSASPVLRLRGGGIISTMSSYFKRMFQHSIEDTKTSAHGATSDRGRKNLKRNADYADVSDLPLNPKRLTKIESESLRGGEGPSSQQSKGADEILEEQVDVKALLREFPQIEWDGKYAFTLKRGFVPGMLVDAKFYASPELLPLVLKELNDSSSREGGGFLPAIQQLANVATLPGIVGSSIGMPDLHSGYGFAIGNVAAMDLDDPEAVVSPGDSTLFPY